MPTLTVVFDDKVIIKDSVALHFEGDGADRFDAVVATEGDSGSHAIQWDGTTGNLEHKDGTPHTDIDAARIAPYVTLFDTEMETLRQAEKTAFLALDAEALAREERDRLISQTDWWVLPDRTPTQAQLDYRQALRDLPTSDSWNPTLTWDDDTWTGSLTGVTWPTKPE